MIYKKLFNKNSQKTAEELHFWCFCDCEDLGRFVGQCVFTFVDILNITHCGCENGRPQKVFQGGAKLTFCSSFSGCWRCNANWRIQKRKCPVLRQQLHTVFSL